MNKPVEHNWSERDIINDYDKFQSKKAVARRYLITVKEVTEILKKMKSEI